MSIIVNFMLLNFVKRANISLQRKSDVYAVTDIDKKSLEYNKERINQETEEIRL